MVTDIHILPDQFSIHPSAFIAPNATLAGTITIGRDASIWFGVVIRADMALITIGDGTNIQDNSVIHVDAGTPAVLGDHVTVGHRAIVHGATIEPRVVIGMGSIILNDAVVESECIIGAGAVIPPGMRVPRGSLVLGVTGKVVRPLTDQERDYIHDDAAVYVMYGRHYKAKTENRPASG